MVKKKSYIEEGGKVAMKADKNEKKKMRKWNCCVLKIRTKNFSGKRGKRNNYNEAKGFENLLYIVIYNIFLIIDNYYQVIEKNLLS